MVILLFSHQINSKAVYRGGAADGRSRGKAGLLPSPPSAVDRLSHQKNSFRETGLRIKKEPYPKSLWDKTFILRYHPS
jgi:hypothetical protein